MVVLTNSVHNHLISPLYSQKGCWNCVIWHYSHFPSVEQEWVPCCWIYCLERFTSAYGLVMYSHQNFMVGSGNRDVSLEICICPNFERYHITPNLSRLSAKSSNASIRISSIFETLSNSFTLIVFHKVFLIAFTPICSFESKNIQLAYVHAYIKWINTKVKSWIYVMKFQYGRELIFLYNFF